MTPSNAKSYKKLLSPNSKLIDLKTDFGKWFCFTNETVKLWITNKIGSYDRILELIYPNVYKIDFEELFLYEETISYDHFVLISSNVEKVALAYVVVRNKEVPYTIVPLEKFVKALPKVKEFEFHDKIGFSSFTKNTVKELLTIPHFSKISKINLHNIPETFDIETFFAFIKKNKISKCDLRFADTVSDEYKTRLEAIIDEILQAENHDYKVPIFDFTGLDRQKWTKLRSLFDKN
uniref:Uncharacterized protein n=1 Tax=Panagrolaimus davidi TaxID=227884 RepID=A0A914PQZ6_9BILA